MNRPDRTPGTSRRAVILSALAGVVRLAISRIGRRPDAGVASERDRRPTSPSRTKPTRILLSRISQDGWIVQDIKFV